MIPDWLESRLIRERPPKLPRSLDPEKWPKEMRDDCIFPPPGWLEREVAKALASPAPILGPYEITKGRTIPNLPRETPPK